MSDTPPNPAPPPGWWDRLCDITSPVLQASVPGPSFYDMPQPVDPIQPTEHRQFTPVGPPYLGTTMDDECIWEERSEHIALLIRGSQPDSPCADNLSTPCATGDQTVLHQLSTDTNVPPEPDFSFVDDWLSWLATPATPAAPLPHTDDMSRLASPTSAEGRAYWQDAELDTTTHAENSSVYDTIAPVEEACFSTPETSLFHDSEVPAPSFHEGQAASDHWSHGKPRRRRRPRHDKHAGGELEPKKSRRDWRTKSWAADASERPCPIAMYDEVAFQVEGYEQKPSSHGKAKTRRPAHRQLDPKASPQDLPRTRPAAKLSTTLDPTTRDHELVCPPGVNTRLCPIGWCEDVLTKSEGALSEHLYDRHINALCYNALTDTCPRLGCSSVVTASDLVDHLLTHMPNSHPHKWTCQACLRPMATAHSVRGHLNSKTCKRCSCDQEFGTIHERRWHAMATGREQDHLGGKCREVAWWTG
jgi:hypothetical protein